ncbi:hypothetical protein STENM223S_09809 [Streptomyces tendae]
MTNSSSSDVQVCGQAGGRIASSVPGSAGRLAPRTTPPAPAPRSTRTPTPPPAPGRCGPRPAAAPPRRGRGARLGRGGRQRGADVRAAAAREPGAFAVPAHQPQHAAAQRHTAPPGVRVAGERHGEPVRRGPWLRPSTRPGRRRGDLHTQPHGEVVGQARGQIGLGGARPAVQRADPLVRSTGKRRRRPAAAGRRRTSRRRRSGGRPPPATAPAARVDQPLVRDQPLLVERPVQHPERLRTRSRGAGQPLRAARPQTRPTAVCGVRDRVGTNRASRSGPSAFTSASQRALRDAASGAAATPGRAAAVRRTTA